MKAVLLLSLFVNILMISKAGHHTRRVRHSDLHSNIHGRQSQGKVRQQRQWQAENYRGYQLQYYPEYNNGNREEALTAEIINLLRELKVNLSTQKQLQYNQPIHIPYPVPLSIQHNVPPSMTGPKKPNIVINKQIPALPSRNNFDDYDDKDYMRPISLKPVTEAASSTTKTTEKTNDSESSIVFKDIEAESQNVIGEPSTCEGAILACCRFAQPKERQMCFSAYKCSKTYATKMACDKNVIQVVVQRFVDTYAPK